ncbi:MAG TPA: hypothetical protein VKZ50_18015 [bacterium]|nr:hypothetical protein [bacterium]
MNRGLLAGFVVGLILGVVTMALAQGLLWGFLNGSTYRVRTPVEQQAYVAGVADALRVSPSDTVAARACLEQRYSGPRVSADQLQEIVGRYLVAHPQSAGAQMAAVTMIAIADTCESPTSH